MKKIPKLLLLMGTVFLTGNAMAQNSYCVPTWSGWAASEPTRPITRVQLGQNGVNGISSTSSSEVSTTNPRYEDFTNLSMNVVRGQSYTLKIKGNTNGNNTDYVTVYYDWNGDGTFSNATPASLEEQQQWTNQPEKHQHGMSLVNSTGEDAVEITYTLNIPTDAVLGSTRMRVVKNYNAPSNSPCSNPFTFGQVEDYTLNIVETNEVGCQGADPGNTPGDIGCVNVNYQGASFEYTTVRGADGNIWLQQNLGSSQTATASNDTAAYGDYFQWGRWDDGHQLANSTINANAPTPNNPSGLNGGSNQFYSAAYNSDSNWWSAGVSTDTWQASTPENVSDVNGCDPCKAAMGSTWRLPTTDELDGMISAEDIININSAYESNLKLVGAGMKDYTGMFVDGTRLYLWSSNASDSSGWGEYLYISPNVSMTNYGDRASGIPVRCIKALANVSVVSVEVTTENNVAATITTDDGTLQLVATVNPSDANQNVAWSITSGEGLATVSDSGLVTAVNNGTVTVRATSLDNETIYDEIEVVISNQVYVEPCTFETLALTGFNGDVIAEGSGNADTQTTQIVDAANVYYASDFVPTNPHSSGTSAASFGGGFPVTGTLNSSATEGLSFQLADFDANNALLLRNSMSNTGTLTLSTPQKAQKLYLASVSAEGTNSVQVKVNFEDGTNQIFTYEATDWWQNGALSNKIVGNLGRVSRGASWSPLNEFSGLSQTGLYQNEFELSATNYNKKIVSVSFTQSSPSSNVTTTAILAISICKTPTVLCTPSDPENIGDTGCVNLTYQNQLIGYTTVKAADGNVWLQQNLGSSQVATASDDASSFGDLFQWGRWDDGHQLRNSATSSSLPTPNNPLGLIDANFGFIIENEWWSNGSVSDTWTASLNDEVTATNGIDPCKAIGADWEIPTETDWEDVISAETITNVATAAESNLKLSVAGVRRDSGINYDGVRGYYWSKTPSTTTGYYKYLYYSNFIVNPNAGDSKNQGASVRCLKRNDDLANHESATINIAVYPNPTSGYLHIKTNQKVKQVEIYNMLGQKIMQTKGIEINLNNQNSGVYVLKVVLENGKTLSQKIIKK